MRARVVRRQAALTLIELLVVMMILVILASAVALSVVNKMHVARVNAAKADIATLEEALEHYQLAMGEYPTSEQGLMALYEPPSGVEADTWRQKGGPFVKKKNFTDPWGHDYLYTSPGADGRDFDIVSYGADGRAGGEGKDADINSWDLGRPSGSSKQ